MNSSKNFKENNVIQSNECNTIFALGHVKGLTAHAYIVVAKCAKHYTILHSPLLQSFASGNNADKIII